MASGYEDEDGGDELEEGATGSTQSSLQSVCDDAAGVAETRNRVSVPAGTVESIRRTKKVERAAMIRPSVPIGGGSLREQLVAAGIIRPVEGFLERARMLHSQVLQDVERQKNRKKATDAKERALKAVQPEANANDGKSAQRPSKVHPCDLSKAEKKRIGRARLRTRETARERGLDANVMIMCMVCGERYLASNRKQHWDERHPEKRADFAGKFKSSYVYVPSGRTSWVHVYQGGLPGLGKRHR